MHPLRVMCYVLLALICASGCRLSANSEQSDQPRDSVISSNVEAQLAGEPSGGFSEILVATEDGTVTLIGTVSRAERKARAAELARQVKGVKRVKNDLEIRADVSP
jgi:hyperosmotically inducible protein